jgi:hypothetical protein
MKLAVMVSVTVKEVAVVEAATDKVYTPATGQAAVVPELIDVGSV